MPTLPSLSLRRGALAALAALALAACGGAEPEAQAPADDEQVTRGPGGKGDVIDSIDGLTFEEFRELADCEPDTDVCVVDGDIPLAGEQALRDYFEERQAFASGALTVMRLDGVDAVWSTQRRQELTYCVDDDFEERKAEVVEAMEQAAADWEAIAHVDFQHLPEHDDRCVANNQQLAFNVTPARGLYNYYIARAFFPDMSRKDRQLRINFPSHDRMADKPDLQGVYTLRGVLRHELGHVLGFRHEHIRDEAHAPRCFEDERFRPLTSYDAASVMHYPQCNGEGSWGLELTETDAIGAAFFYPDFGDYEAARCPAELTVDGRVDPACEPVVRELLELANTASFEVLDDWVGLDRRAAEEIVELREREPLNRLEQLYAIRYLAEVSVRKMYEYLYVDGRCPSELSASGIVDARCRPIVHRILELANTADQATLDDEVRLDRRAAANIVTIRSARPFASMAELISVSWVKTRAVRKMYEHLYPEPPAPR